MIPRHRMLRTLRDMPFEIDKMINAAGMGVCDVYSQVKACYVNFFKCNESERRTVFFLFSSHETHEGNTAMMLWCHWLDERKPVPSPGS